MDRTCEVCSKVFKYPSDLKSHQKRRRPCIMPQQTDDKQIPKPQCGYCRRDFANAFSLRRHGGSCPRKLEMVAAAPFNAQKEIGEIKAMLVELKDRPVPAPTINDNSLTNNIGVVINNYWVDGKPTLRFTEVDFQQVYDGNPAIHDMFSQELTDQPENAASLLALLTKKKFEDPSARSVKLSDQKMRTMQVITKDGEWVDMPQVRVADGLIHTYIESSTPNILRGGRLWNYVYQQYYDATHPMVGKDKDRVAVQFLDQLIEHLTQYAPPDKLAQLEQNGVVPPGSVQKRAAEQAAIAAAV